MAKVIKKITNKERGSGKGQIYPWDKVRVGQAFSVAIPKTENGIRALRNQAYVAGLKYDRKFSVSKSKLEILIERIS